MFWKKMAQTYLFNQTCMAAYFNDLNLRELYSRRGDILEVGARELGLQLEHEFGPRPAGRPIRLGILSSHFHPSAETHAALPLFEHLGKEFEVYLYCFQATEHPLEQYVRDRCKSFKLLPPALDAQAQTIRQDDLDILFFATNVTAGTNGACALGLQRLARAQATSISAVTTSGLPKMDYYVSGTWTDPAPDAAEHYRERLLRMEGSAHCFSCGTFDPPPTLRADRAAWGVAPRDVLFASGANYHKLIPEFLDTCMKILSQVPGSHLMLMPFGPHWSHQYPRARFMDHIWDMARRRDVAPSRVHILNVIPAPERQDIKELVRAADVYLDSYPFGGSTSLMEPLETGVPVVVQRGSQLRGAMASGIMRELGIAELIADDEAA
jgi:predicted O-linked N-acetylglucosamine transferase (SPINDLY family)